MLKLLLSAIVYVLVQVLLIKDIALFDAAFCFLYILPVLMLSSDFSHTFLLILAFILGLLVDLFYNTLGFHASALVALAFLRPYWISLLAPSGGYDIGVKLNIDTMGLQWFASYSIPLVFTFSLILFCVEAGGLTMFHRSLIHAFFSTILTFLAMVLSQYLFHAKQ